MANDGSTYITMHWGKAGVSAPGYAAQTWDGFSGVYHLGEGSSPAYDATSNDKDGTWSGNTQYAGGAIGAAQAFLCSNPHSAIWDVSTYIQLPSGLISAARPTPNTPGRTYRPRRGMAMLAIGGAGGTILTGSEGHFKVWKSVSLRGCYSDCSDVDEGVDFPRDSWQAVAVTYDAATTTMRLYRNGTQVGVKTDEPGTAGDAGSPMQIGARGDWSGRFGFEGQIDEVRVSTAARSADWIWAEYNTEGANASFQTYVAQEPTSQAGNPTLRNVAAEQMDVSCTAGDGASRLVVMSASAISATPTDETGYTANAAFGSGDTIAAGVYVVGTGSGPITVTGLMPGRTYYVKAFEFNGTGAGANYLTTAPGAASQATTTKALTVVDFAANDKPYDGNTTATASSLGHPQRRGGHRHGDAGHLQRERKLRRPRPWQWARP